MMIPARRRFATQLATLSAAAAGLLRAAGAADTATRRVIVCNDFSGDPDGLFALVHQLLSPSTAVTAVIGTLLPSDLQGRRVAGSADAACTLAAEALRVMGLSESIPLHAGANTPMRDSATPQPSPGASAIIAEAMRDDPRPLYITAGASLTDIASAWLLEPRIAERATLIWIGGASHPAGGAEYNLAGDIAAAMALFNHSRLPIWQVPADAYAQCLYALSEFETEIKPRGAIGAWLWQHFMNKMARLPSSFARNRYWPMGDSPAVLLSALGSASSLYQTRPTPQINPDQSYTTRTDGRPMRVYQHIDNRLMFADFHALLKLRYG
jgi:inosine-uridine nucleoside N-ribohydrolase